MTVGELIAALHLIPESTELHLGSYGYEGEYVVLDADLGNGNTLTVAEHDFGNDKGTIIRRQN